MLPPRAAIVRAMLATCTLVLPVQTAKAQVSVCALCSCGVTSTGLAFGNYDAGTTAPRDVNATVTVNCTSLAQINGGAVISLSGGESGNPAARRMVKGADTLTYQIYSNTARTTVWGNGTGGTSTVTVSLTGLLSSSATATAYGRIPARQFVRAGAYTDTVTITVTY
ncbi:spore coat U domain-containing protein [Novosphingobium sp. 9]|uniref:Csu type fimbrial protein n=1 Tax=Novosphingobium sp. 9 TaxID=2025349 RepID=UPI0021B525B6|nr:spore coat U domain-containing protein [Novosphingobium sp. 9]